MKNKDIRYEYEIDGDVSYVYLTQRDETRHTVIVDSKNLDRVLNYKYKWYVDWDVRTECFYAKATIYLGTENGKANYTVLYLHRFILDDFVSRHIDHKNSNTLDEREDNLRPSTQSENTKNRRAKNFNNTSGHRNVSWIRGCWRVQLQIDGRNYMFPEKFEDVDEAGLFAEEMRQKHYGSFAGLN